MIPIATHSKGVPWPDSLDTASSRAGLGNTPSVKKPVLLQADPILEGDLSYSAPDKGQGKSDSNGLLLPIGVTIAVIAGTAYLVSRDKKEKLAGAEPYGELAKQTASIVPFLVKTAVVCGIGYYVYRRITNRFIDRKEVAAYGPANITMGEAQARADAIYGSKGVFTNDFETVQEALTRLNYNGYIRVYNAFGKRRGTLLTGLSGGLTLEEWLYDQYSEDEVAQLSALLNGVFLS